MLTCTVVLYRYILYILSGLCESERTERQPVSMLGIGDLPRFKTIQATTQSPELWSCIRYIGFDYARYALVVPSAGLFILGHVKKAAWHFCWALFVLCLQGFC